MDFNQSLSIYAGTQCYFNSEREGYKPIPMELIFDERSNKGRFCFHELSVLASTLANRRCLLNIPADLFVQPFYRQVSFTTNQAQFQLRYFNYVPLPISHVACERQHRQTDHVLNVKYFKFALSFKHEEHRMRGEP